MMYELDVEVVRKGKTINRENHMLTRDEKRQDRIFYPIHMTI
jgi:hypothetical protein